MRCQDARQKLSMQRDSNEAQADTQALQEHLRQCPGCLAFEKRQRSLDSVLRPSATPVYTGISTERIMLAVQKQARITQQLEDIRQQQQSRMARWRTVGAALAAIALFTVSSIPLLALAIIIIQTDLAVKLVLLLGSVIDTFVVLEQYLQPGLTQITHDNWLLSGVAFVMVVMMGMWLRLMRHPQEV
ncbi:MAG TPA: hypothetical protein VFB60_20730 [Ktedonobacteraceae bacterium]|nr:hypothetical protein [Ktedonobacteraceae bacterium]